MKRVSGKGDVLIVVDVQKAFSAPPKLIDGIQRCAKNYKRKIFTRFENRPGSLFRTRLKQHCCGPGTPDLALAIQPEKGDWVLTKNGYGLTARDVKRIKALRPKRVTVCGIDTDACVLGVMFSLFDAGIDCCVKQDLCWSSSGKHLHQAAMKIIEQQFPPPKG
jgi:nicotinamidase-related amidase